MPYKKKIKIMKALNTILKEGLFDVDSSTSKSMNDVKFKFDLTWIKDESLRDVIMNDFSITNRMKWMKTKGYDIEDYDKILKIHDLASQCKGKKITDFNKNELDDFLEVMEELNEKIETINKTISIIRWIEESNLEVEVFMTLNGSSALIIQFAEGTELERLEGLNKIKISGMQGPKIVKTRDGEVIVKYKFN